MSTITFVTLDRTAVRRGLNFRWIATLITGLVLIAGVILVAASAANVDTPSGVVAVPVQTAPAVDAQHVPAADSTPGPSPIVIAVPVATAPSQ